VIALVNPVLDGYRAVAAAVIRALGY